MTKRRGSSTRGGPRQANATKSVSSGKSSTSKLAAEPEDDVKIDIASLTLDVPLIPFRKPRRVPASPFHFLSLPSELRLKIYDYYFDEKDTVIDLSPHNHKVIHKRLVLMKVCKQLRDEATHYFYSTRCFRIFPTYPGRYFKTKKPLLSRMKPHQRREIGTLELRLGPGWNAPPAGWTVNPALGLQECVGCHKLVVFVEFDPSDTYFKGFRRSEGFYEAFSKKLFLAVLSELPGIQVIEFDGWRSVKKSGAMMNGLLGVAEKSGKLISWGPERGWTDEMEEENVKEETETDSETDMDMYQDVPITGYPSQNILAAA